MLLARLCQEVKHLWYSGRCKEQNMAMQIIIFFGLGLIIGSFLNVVVYRLEVMESILGRSHCPRCHKQIRWFDNIPLFSFLILKARCRDCQGRISWQYPLLEFFTGVVFAVTAYYFFNPLAPESWTETAFWLISFAILLVIIAYDLKRMEIPMLVLWIGVLVAVAYFLFADAQAFRGIEGIRSSLVYSGAAGGLVAFFFLFALVFFSKEKWMGLGDAYLGILIGLLAGWPLILVALILSFTLGAVVGVGLILGRKRTLQSQIPFAPFLAGGTMLAIFLSHSLPELGNQLRFIF